MTTMTANVTRVALLALVLTPAVASAQALPIVPESPNVLSRTTTRETRDVFRARRDTFVPRDEPGLLFPVSSGVWPVWSQPSPVAPVIIVIQQPPAAAPVTAPAAPPPAPPAVTLPPPAPPHPPATQKTLYVIPGCYAGDKLPRPDQLRQGCSLRDLRTISPVL